MKKKFTFFTGIAFILILTSASACNQPVSQPISQPGNEFFDRCDQMEKNIEQAQSIALQLQNFSWDEFSEIGILCPPQGICPVGNLPIVEKASLDKQLLDRVVPVTEGLPNPHTAETYSVQCASCLNLAREVCSNSPYSKTQVEGSDNITAQWQELCGQLQSALQGAEYLASRDKTIAADYTFPKLFAYFSASDEKVKQKYLEKFTARSDEYIKLHEDFIQNMQEAEQTAIDLSNWHFTSQDATIHNSP
jgi:hypothetical protein